MEHEADLFGLAGTLLPDADLRNDEAFEQGAFFPTPTPHSNGIPSIRPTERSEFQDSYFEGQDDERLRLGRELHDSTGQLLLALRLCVGHLRHLQPSENRDEILGEIEDTVVQIDHEIRTLSYLNYPAELGKHDLVAALEIFTKVFGKRTGLKVKFQSCCEKAQAYPPVAAALLRIAQEAMTNVYRHARASSVHVSLVQRRGLVELIIKDDGCGLAPADHPEVAEGVGMQGMRHRIERLGGTFKVWGLKKGTRVAASLPNARFYTTAAA